MSTRTAYDRALAFPRGSRALVVFGVVALFAHGALGVALSRQASAAGPAAPSITEYEIEAPKPPEPEPEPEPARDETVSEPSAPTVAAPSPRPTPARAATAAPAAKAGAVMTAEGDDGPVSFVTDPLGGEYGHGTVAPTGTAASATGAAAAIPQPASPPPPPPPPPPVAAAPPKWERPPRLEGADPCKGFFPGDADDDRAVVTLAVAVRATGEVSSASVLSETPPGQGFGKAARACLLSRRFVPAERGDGEPVSATATVNVRFSR